MSGAPRVIHNPARAIDGPAMFPGSRVKPEGVVQIAGRLTHLYFVSSAQNQGSAASGHLALVWNVAGHTYAYSFHAFTTLANARALDLELARHLVGIHPRASH